MANVETIEKKRSFSFKRGFNQLMKKDVRNARIEIMEALELTSPQNFYHRLNGKVEPRMSEGEAIEKIFAKYGVTDIWGEK